MRFSSWLLCFGLFVVGCDEPTDGEEPPPQETGGAEDEGAEPLEPEPTEPTESGSRVSPDGMCGGIAGFVCPEGQWCDMEGDYPDASGTCRPEGACEEAADCAEQDLVHAMCVGEWQCNGGECAWVCS